MPFGRGQKWTMGISGRLYDGVIAFAKAVAGREKVDKKVASLLGGTPASWRAWSGDPYQQIIEYRNWIYTAIRFRALRRQVPPIVARYVDAGEIEGERAERRKAFAFGGAMPKKRNIVSRQKAIGSGISRIGHELEYLPTSSAPMRLLHDPNDPQIGIDLWYMCSVFEDLTGRVHIWKVRDGAGRVVELWYLPTQWCDPRPGDGKLINQLLVTMPSGGSVILDADDVITIGEPSPFGYLAWQSPLQAHGLTVDLNNALFVSRFNGLINGSHVGSMIKVPSSMANNPDSMARLEQSLLSRTVGTINYNRPLIAEEGAELINLTPQMELAFSQSANQMRDNIFAAFDLDASVMGYANEATYAASVVTQKNVFNKVVKPYWERRNATLTEKLLKMEFGLDLCAINEHKTEETPDEKERRLRFMKESGAISVNEIRVEYEKEPYDDPRYDEPIALPGAERMPLGGLGDLGGFDFGQELPAGENQIESQTAENVEAQSEESEPTTVGEAIGYTKGFTGTIVDKLGRKIRYVNGVRVAGEQKLPEGKKPAGQNATPSQKKPAGKVENKKPAESTAGKIVEAKPMSEKAKRAKASYVLIDRKIQRYAEEYNEARLAKVLVGVSFPNGEPIDISIPKNKKNYAQWESTMNEYKIAYENWKKNGKKGKAPVRGEMTGPAAHGIELKTKVVGKIDKLTMDSYAQVRKIVWEKSENAAFHTIVSDDRKMIRPDGTINEKNKRVYYYRRGVAGSASLSGMLKVENEAELIKLMQMPEAKLPAPAQRTDGHLRVGTWVPFKDKIGKGFRNTETGKVFRAKK
jgi:hypothetical protein